MAELRMKLQTRRVETSKGGSISLQLSNIYLHCVLDLWFEIVIKPNLNVKAY